MTSAGLYRLSQLATEARHAGDGMRAAAAHAAIVAAVEALACPLGGVRSGFDSRGTLPPHGGDFNTTEE